MIRGRTEGSITGLLANKGGWSACVPDGEHERALARQAVGQDLQNKYKRPNLAVPYPIRAHSKRLEACGSCSGNYGSPPFPGGASNLLMHHAPRLVVRS